MIQKNQGHLTCFLSHGWLKFHLTLGGSRATVLLARLWVTPSYFCGRSLLTLIYFIHPFIASLMQQIIIGYVLCAILFLKKYFLFIYFWLCWVLVTACNSELQCMVFFSSWGTQDSVVVAHGLSCPTACGILVSQPGIEPTFPALAGGFLTPGPPGKSVCAILISGSMQIGFMDLGFIYRKRGTWCSAVGTDKVG